MICQNCNRNISKPLELYNGDWACPKCKSVLNVKSIAVKVNKENDETFKLSELCYLRALKCHNDPKKYEKELASAIGYCRTAARMGNPKALMRLAFYYEHGYISADVTESFRIAYEYYRLVWNSNPEMEERADDPDYAESCKKLRSASARHYLELLKKLPESFRKVGNLNYHEERSKILAKGLTVPDDADMEAAIEENRISHVLDVLQSCFSKENSPLFGVMKLESGEFAALREVKTSGAAAAPKKLVKFAQKLLIVLFNADTGDMQTIKTAEDCDSVAADGAYYLYFFNGHGEHDMPERKCLKVGKALRQSTGFGEYGGVKRMIEAMGRSPDQIDLVFSVDDVLMYKSRLESISHATDNLVNAVDSRDKK